jgi:hypothetical protein
MTKIIAISISFFAILSFSFSMGWFSGRKNLEEKYMFGFEFELYDPDNRNVCINQGHNYKVEGWYSGKNGDQLEVWVERFEGAPTGAPRHKWQTRRSYSYFFNEEAHTKHLFGDK